MGCISREELEELGERIVKRYLASAGLQLPVRCIDIEGLAEQMGLSVVFRQFAEDDPDKIGFLSDGLTALKIRERGNEIPYIFPPGTIVLEQKLHKESESGRKRFTIAHEIAHFVLDRQLQEARFHDRNNFGREYSANDLDASFSMEEAQVDRLAAAMLMPHFIVGQALQDVNQGNKIKVYGDDTIAPEDRIIIQKMANQAGVSFTAMKIRLREIRFYDYCPLSDFVRKDPEGQSVRTAGRMNPRYREPAPDILEKLELSRQAAENVRTREMRCPRCGFLVQIIPVTQKEVVFVKCQKCKFEAPLSPVHFRRMKRYHDGLKEFRNRQVR